MKRLAVSLVSKLVRKSEARPAAAPVRTLTSAELQRVSGGLQAAQAPVKGW